MEQDVKKRTITVTRGGTVDYQYRNIYINTIYKNHQKELIKVRIGDAEGSLQLNGRQIVEDDSYLSFNDWVETFVGTDIDTLRRYAGVER